MERQAIADLMVKATVDYTTMYFNSLLGRDGKMSRELWGALHFGIIVGLESCGYPRKIIYEGLDLAQKDIIKLYGDTLVQEKASWPTTPT